MNEKKRVTIVVQRYGEEFAGGSEYLARWLALQLKTDFSIEVLTTTAIDAATWENQFPAGVSEIDGIQVRRFPSVRTRDYNTFLKLSDKVLFSNHNLEEEFEWLEQQGPVCPDLIAYIDNHMDSIDLFVFITYLYYPTYFGLHRAGPKSVFIPTAHDEPPIYLTIYRHLFWLPGGIIFLAEEEKDFILDQFHPIDRPWIVAGIGTDISGSDLSALNQTMQNSCVLPDTPYIYSCGRIESAKGYEQLFTYFLEYVNRHDSPLKLVLSGNAHMDIPDSPYILYKGFVSDEEKMFLLQNAVCVVIPSHLESFSMLALEAWNCGKAVIANGNSKVLSGHIQRGNGGWTYQEFKDFETILNLVETGPDHVSRTGAQGKKYAKSRYSAKIIADKYRTFISGILSADNTAGENPVKCF